MNTVPAGNIHIVLVETTHPGNIGATARAMKTMGIRFLHLVSPKIFPGAEVTARASGADDILNQAVVHKTLAEAVMDCGFVLATSARRRSIAWPVLEPEEAAEQIVSRAQVGAKIAIVFGRESSGLNNEELEHCHGMIKIPVDPDFSSLNIAAAVQIICYEIRKAILKSNPEDADCADKIALASTEQMGMLYTHLESCLTDIGYYDPDKPRLLMRRLKRLFNRAGLDQDEYNILRGILASVQQTAAKQKD